jgi:heat shock protein HslJ
MNIRNLARSVVVVIIVAAGIGCASSAALPTSPSASNGSTSLTTEQLAGPWRLQSIQVAGQAVQSAPADANYSVTFSEGRIAARADCNSCNSGFALSGSKLSIASAMACTRAACPTMQFESVYTSLLSGEHTISINGSTMTWSSDRGSLSFVR